MDADLARKSAGDALRDGLKRIGEAAADVVFADPPYGYEDIRNLPRYISESYLCAAEGFFIIEHGKKTEMPRDAGYFENFREKNYGDSCLSFYRYAADGFF